MPDPTDTTTPVSNTKPFNTDEFTENAKKGAIIGSISTTMTFSGIDKPLAHATKAVADGAVFSIKSFTENLMHGNFSACWNNSLYVKAYRACLEHPIKGYSVALLNSCMKNVVFFPAKYASEMLVTSITSDEQAAKTYSGFLAGIATVYITTPISVVKTRMMTNVPLNTLNPKRLMSGVNCIALRDGVQFGVYFNAIDILNAQFGYNPLVSGAAGVIGYIFSNPLSVIGLNQKTSPVSVNALDMGKQIFKSSGAKGFYPLVGLSAFGMFARGMAIGQGMKVYDLLMSRHDETQSSVKFNKE